MFVRHAAAILFAGLAFVTPVLADTLVRESDLSLDLREGELPAPVTSSFASTVDAVVAELPAVEVPGPLAELSTPDSQNAAAQPSQAAALPGDAAAAVALVSSRDDSENFSWMTADVAFTEEMTTGSIGNDGSALSNDHVELTATPSTAMISPSEDALSIDAPVIP